MCPDETIADVNVVTRSMTAAQVAQNGQLISQTSANEQLELGNATESAQISAVNTSAYTFKSSAKNFAVTNIGPRRSASSLIKEMNSNGPMLLP